MDALEVRSLLLQRFEKKNETHINNMYALAAIIFGLLFSDRLGYLPKPFILNIYELVISFAPLFLYCLLRARYWSTMVLAIMFVKPIVVNYDESSEYEENLLGQLNHACNVYFHNNEENVLGVIPLRWSTERRFKYFCILSFIILLILSLLIEIPIPTQGN